jgi:cysteate synthase
MSAAQLKSLVERLPQRHYSLVCQECGSRVEDDGFVLQCSNPHGPALLRTEYASRKFVPDPDGDGIFRYQRWLPFAHRLDGTATTQTFQSERLSRITGLSHLWIAFNGYYPERQALLTTTTFKELEAYAVLARLPSNYSNVLVVASAGNTAAAFAQTCSRNRRPCLIIIPQSALPKLSFINPIDPCVKIVTIDGDADYYDAIFLAEQISQVAGFFPEGGVRNVARRDGIATALLNAVEKIGRLPDYYFQAVGSGTGGIAIHEAARRLRADGRFGLKLPRLMLSQNRPFVPMVESWKLRQRQFVDQDRNEARQRISQIVAPVLSNLKPPYSTKGGVFDILSESRGDMVSATNAEALTAARFFCECEGIDIDPAAGVAVATLLKACRQRRIEPSATVLLHITGAGSQRRERDYRLIAAEPALRIDRQVLGHEAAVISVMNLF